MAFFDTKLYDRESFEKANEAFGYPIHFFRPRLNADTVQLAAGFSVVCVFVNDTLSGPVVLELERLGVRLIALRCAGYNQVDLKTAYDRIRVVRVPFYSPHAVAEHAVALALALNRKTHKAYHRTRDSNFAIQGLMGFDMNGKIAGIVGTGKIGRITARIFRGFGMKVLAYDPFPNAAAAKAEEFHYVDLDTLYSQADILSLHCPLTPETEHMIHRGSIAKMKPGVMLINTGRGKLIRTPDLIQGLKSRHIGSAGLDVYEEEESYFFEDFSSKWVDDDVLARLLTFPNVLITSHQAFFTQEALTQIADITLGNIRAFFQKDPLENQICHRCGASGCRPIHAS